MSESKKVLKPFKFSSLQSWRGHASIAASLCVYPLRKQQRSAHGEEKTKFSNIWFS